MSCKLSDDYETNVTSRYDNGVDDEDNDGCNGYIVSLYGDVAFINDTNSTH